jgi:TRAP-type uncharacterized transport system fused permease subunit
MGKTIKNAAGWLIAGAFVGIGFAGLLTGLPLIGVGILIGVRLGRRRTSGTWASLVGVGFGLSALFLGDVLRFDNDECIGRAGRGFECVASGAHEFFWVGVAIASVGVVWGIVTGFSGDRRSTNDTEPPPFSSRPLS